MVRLLTIKAYIAVLKRAIAISRKLKPRTWVYLAITQAALAAICFWGYRQLHTPEERPQVNNVPMHRIYVDDTGSYPYWSWASSPSILAHEFSVIHFSGHGYDARVRGHNAIIMRVPSERNNNCFILLSHHLNPRELNVSDYHMHFSTERSASLLNRQIAAMMISAEDSSFSRTARSLDVWDAMIQGIFPLPRLPRYDVPVVLQFSATGGTSALDALMKPLLLIQGIFLTVGSALSSIFAWIQYQRGKVDLKLKKLQIREMEIRLENMERDRARAREAEARSGIILLS